MTNVGTSNIENVKVWMHTSDIELLLHVERAQAHSRCVGNELKHILDIMLQTSGHCETDLETIPEPFNLMRT